MAKPINRGLTMGCPLSPFLANLFMSFRETELTQFEWLSRYGKGMVDKMNSLSETIQFTVEREMEFDIYRKPTTTSMLYSHKLSTFSSMMQTSQHPNDCVERYTKELNFIMNFARINGYNKGNEIERLIVEG